MPQASSADYVVAVGDWDGNGLTDLSFTTRDYSKIFRFLTDGSQFQSTLTAVPDHAIIEGVPLR